MRGWKWPWTLVVPLFLLLLVVDGALFSANMMKFVEGGWCRLPSPPLLFIAMWTWYRGRHAVELRERERTVPIDTLLATIEPERLHRTQGTAIYLTTFSDAASSSLMQNLRHNGVLHEHVVLLTVHLLEEPFVSPEDRLRVRELGSGILRAVLCYGFMEKPDVAHDIAGLAGQGIPIDPLHTSFFIGHNNVVSGQHPLLPSWQRRLFLMLSRFAASSTDFLGLPANQTVELGSRIEV